MGREYVHVSECGIPYACSRRTVMQRFSDISPATAHYVKPVMRNYSQIRRVDFHPRVNRRSRFTDDGSKNKRLIARYHLAEVTEEMSRDNDAAQRSTDYVAMNSIDTLGGHQVQSRVS